MTTDPLRRTRVPGGEVTKTEAGIVSRKHGTVQGIGGAFVPFCPWEDYFNITIRFDSRYPDAVSSR